MFDSTQVIAYFKNRQVKPTAFKHNDIKYSIKDVLQTKDVETLFLM